MAISGGKGGELSSEINVTPLVDVMLVLLVIFMVTAPMLQAGVDLKLPQAEAKSLPDTEDKTFLRIDKYRRLSIGGADAEGTVVTVKWVELQATLGKLKAEKNLAELYIEAHEELPYAIVLRAMTIARAVEIDKLYMVTDPTENAPLPEEQEPK